MIFACAIYSTCHHNRFGAREMTLLRVCEYHTLHYGYYEDILDIIMQLC